jgi:hypothetical protein
MIFRAAALTISLLGISAALLWGGARAASGGQPVLVELFTSQGCSDCPPADQILSDLAGRSDVIALSFPITYWDMLGWRDTLASVSNTDRQKAYADAMRRPATYTPQIIVGGVDDVVGNKRERVFNAVAGHVAGRGSRVDPEAVSLVLSYDAGELVVRISGTVPSDLSPDRPADLWVMRILSHAEVTVQGGENRDRHLVYTNIVRDITSAGSWSGGEATFSVPVALAQGEHDGIAVVLQHEGHGPVLAAGLINLPTAATR